MGGLSYEQVSAADVRRVRRAIGDWTAVEAGNHLAGLGIDIADLANITIVDLLVVVILDLRYLVAKCKGIHPNRSRLNAMRWKACRCRPECGCCHRALDMTWACSCLFLARSGVGAASEPYLFLRLRIYAIMSSDSDLEKMRFGMFL